MSGGSGTFVRWYDSELDLLTQRAVMAQTAATPLPLRKQLAQTRDQLTALLGRLPEQAPSVEFTCRI